MPGMYSPPDMQSGIPLVFFILGLFPTTNRIYESVTDDADVSFVLSFLSALSVFAHGFFNTGIYIISRYIGPLLEYILVSMKSRYDTSQALVTRIDYDRQPHYYTISITE